MRSRCCLCIPLIVARQRLGKNPLKVARQRLGKNPLIVARQRIGRNVTALMNTHATASRPSCFIPEETVPGTHCISGWVGPRAGLDAVE
jgi:hypothetical protein